MSEIKKRDILKFLDGTSKKKKIEEIRTWAYESVENAQDLAYTQKIYKESSELKGYNPIDESLEWNSFKTLLNSDNNTIEEETEAIGSSDLTNLASSSIAVIEAPTDNDVLNYLEDNLPSNSVEDVESWMKEDLTFGNDLSLSKEILSQSEELATFKVYDMDTEWAMFSNNLSAGSPKVVAMTPVVDNLKSSRTSYDTKDESDNSIFPLWVKYAAAAIALLLGVWYWNSTNMMRSGDVYVEYATLFNTHQFDMIDGSRIFLDQNSRIRYPKGIEGLDERRLYLEGRGEFDVVTNEEKPFIVELSDEIGVEVIGTIFKVFAHEDYLKAVENIEGKVRAYSIKNPELYVELGSGDKYGWDGEQFIDINHEEVVDNSKEYEILYVLDYLMANSNWKVISSPNMPFDEIGMVKVDLKKDLDQILEDLRERAQFNYVELSCDNCYRITQFEQLESE